MEAVAPTISIPKYDAYKDSGVEWLGEIPEHWEVLANKHIFKLKKNEVGKKSSEYTLLSLTLNGVIERDMINPQGKFPAEFNTYQEVKRGDFVFCLFDVEETPRAVGLSPFDGMITGAYTVMEPESNFDRAFLYYFYLNLDNDKRLRPLYKGLRNTIPKEAFFSFKTFVPPFEEQTAIADFLDRKTAAIDKAIAQKEALLERLKERRQILIHRAVTCGLNPEVRMKDSGVEWIGEVPEHWEVKKLKYHFNLISGGTPSKERADFWNGDIPWVSPKDMKSDYISKSEDYITAKGLQQMNGRLLPKDTLLMVVRSGILQRKIPVAITVAELSINQDIKAFVRVGNVASKFLFHFIVGCDNHLRNEWVKQVATVESIEIPLMNNAMLLIPPAEEQDEIIQHIERSAEKFEVAIQCKQTEIARLKEYKSTLINAAVTGKIKVC